MGEWIPVSERLPEHGVNVLVTAEDRNNNERYMLTAWHWGNKGVTWLQGWHSEGVDCFKDKYKVLAWMPLPEKYNERSNMAD